jgi:hypothetical protein
MRGKKEAPRTDWEIVRSALIDEEIVTHMKDWRSWLAAFALIALMFAYLHLVGWVVSVWM